RGAEGDGVTKNILDGLVACDHPITQFRAVEHRQLFARPAYEFGRIRHVGILKRIKVFCHTAQGTGAPLFSSVIDRTLTCLLYNSLHSKLLTWGIPPPHYLRNSNTQCVISFLGKPSAIYSLSRYPIWSVMSSS